jgi:hypothetical protein
MNFIKSFVRQTVKNAREISSMSEKHREVMGNASAMLAKGYMADFFRAADFITAITKNPSPEEVMKLIMPATTQAINHTNKILNDLNIQESPTTFEESAEEGCETQEEAREEAEAEALRAQFDLKPKSKFEVKINPKVWNPRGAN